MARSPSGRAEQSGVELLGCYFTAALNTGR